MTSPKGPKAGLMFLHRVIGHHLEQIEKHMPRGKWKLTFIARHVDDSDPPENLHGCDITVGDDTDVEKIIETLRYLTQANKPEHIVEIPATDPRTDIKAKA